MQAVRTVGQRETGAARQPPTAIEIDSAGLAKLIEEIGHVVEARCCGQLVGVDRSPLGEEHGEADLAQALMGVDRRQEHRQSPRSARAEARSG
jgi:hypothetical protein